jgi:hypothetical protein
MRQRLHVSGRSAERMWKIFRHAGAVGRRILAMTALGSLISACSIHPLPDDVTGLSTYSIVRQIRCETRDEVIASTIRFLTDKDNYDGDKVDDRSRAIGLKLAADSMR